MSPLIHPGSFGAGSNGSVPAWRVRRRASFRTASASGVIGVTFPKSAQNVLHSTRESPYPFPERQSPANRRPSLSDSLHGG